MKFIFLINMINSCNKHDTEKCYSTAELPIGKDKQCEQFVNK